MQHHYKTLEEFYHEVPEAVRLKHLLDLDVSKTAKGSNHNHQTWEGGFIDHVVETLNIAVWLYKSSPRPFQFTLKEALMVMFLHDLEKPFKKEFGHTWETKEDRRSFRNMLVHQCEIQLTSEQWNALDYVEGEHDYSNTERKMKPLAAFCHVCDIMSARLWHDHGQLQSW